MEAHTETGLHDLNLASRKAEDAALRRIDAASWLESLVGPLGLPERPSEKDFVSCLRNGLILCNVVNKIQPGAVTKVVECSTPTQSLTWDSQPLPAYQYFENVRNFLVVLGELKLPAFEASDLERDHLEAGSSAKVVNCVLALKSYHESKKMNKEIGAGKFKRSPVVHSSSRPPLQIIPGVSSSPCRKLDMNSLSVQQPHNSKETTGFEGSFTKVLSECVLGAKENIEGNLLLESCSANGDLDVMKFLKKIMEGCLEEKIDSKLIEEKLVSDGHNLEEERHPSSPCEKISEPGCCGSCPKVNTGNHLHLIHAQKRNLLDIKALLSQTRKEFEDFQSLFTTNMKFLGDGVREMSIAALGYQKVVKENRDLYNTVMDLKGNIRVYCRIRPMLKTGTKNVVDFFEEDGSMGIIDPSKSHKDARKVFQFNRVFGPSSSQDDIFSHTKPLIRSVMDGYNVCIFAYGQTGSGKTHTMSGPPGGLTKDMGINYLALDDLFNISNERKNAVDYDIDVQMVEIYNEQVRDLISEDSSTTKLEIRSCTSVSGLSLPDATMNRVKCTRDVLKLMKVGEMNRVVSATAVNSRSSRSHSVLSVHVHGKDKSGSITRSCLHLVDLAGSERVDKSEVTGDRLKEAQHINKSLSCLGDVITALAQKSSYIPYRNSKLTLLLQDSLGGQAKTLMIAHVGPEMDSFGETVSTLKFAQRASSVELGAAQLNKDTSEVIALREQVESLKKEVIANKEIRTPLSHKPKKPLASSVMVSEIPTLARPQPNSDETPSSSGPHPGYVIKRPLPADPKYGKKDCLFPDPKPVIHPSRLYNPEFEESTPRRPLNPSSAITTYTPHNTPKTPEKPLSRLRDSVPYESAFPPVNSPATGSMSNMNNRRSQIRKSLRSIGKLINGSDKSRAAAGGDILNPGVGDNNKSPTMADRRSLRRQSLAGVGLDGCLLGGPSTDSYVNRQRNAKTPPPARQSIAVGKRWQ